MAKKSSGARKPSGAAAISVIDDDRDEIQDEAAHASNGSGSPIEPAARKTPRGAKPKATGESTGQFAVADIKKAAAFANSVGGLDKAITLLQILKVAKDVQ